MQLKQIFARRDRKVFIAFDEIGSHLHKMGHLLQGGTADAEHPSANTAKEMHDVAQRVEASVRALHTQIASNFVIPFDREDIHYLTTELLAIAHNLLHVTRQSRTYGVSFSHGATKSITGQVGAAIAMIEEMLNNLKNTTKLPELAVNCTVLREKVSSSRNMLDADLSHLLNSGSEDMLSIKMADHCNSLQKLLDKIGDTANAFDAIIVKYT